jgi:hypothetical protein
MGGACSTHGRDEKYNILVGKPEGKRPLRRPRRISEDNIRTDLGEIGYEIVEWIYLVRDRGLWWVF